MNRNIKFSGKLIKDSDSFKTYKKGTIIEGGYCKQGDKHFIVAHFNVFEVEEHSVSQFTEFLNKEKVEIFESHILEIVNNEGKTLIGNVKWNKKRGCYEVIARYNGKMYDRIWLDETTAYFSKVLGNINDNPELLQNAS